MFGTKKLRELDEILELLITPGYSGCVKTISGFSRDGFFDGRLIVETTLPLDVRTAVGLQILGDRAVADPDLELTILVSLEEEA